MTRLVSTMQLDVKLQIRNRFYHIVFGLALLNVIALPRIFGREQLAEVLPVLLLMIMSATTFLLVAGMVIFEKGERNLEALVITPVRNSEYLLSKLITLTALATVEAAFIALLTYGLGFNPLLLFGGIIVLGLMYTLFGFILVVRYNTVTDFLVPAMLVILALQIPFLDALGMLSSPLFYLIPTQAPLLLMKAAFEPIEVWQLVYALAYAAVTIGVTFAWAQRAFNRFVILGGRRD
ncbi:MAG: ABC transporter permease [Chloroflexi bacterium]|nr:ABC transporter permease [Chloroflexota bacterium]